MHQLIIAVAMMHHGPMPQPMPAPPKQVDHRDPLTRQIDAVANSGKPLADKLDALFFALRGRLASGREHWQAKSTLGENPTGEQLKKFVKDPPAPYLFGMNQNPFGNGFGVGWAPRPPVLPDYAIPIYSEGPGGVAIVVGYFVPVPALGHPTSPPCVSSPTPSTGAYLIPNTLSFPLTPWIPPGSSVPLARLGR